MASTVMCYPAIEGRRCDLGVSKQRVADYLEISYSAVDNKLSGRSEFKFTEVKKLSDWWNTPLSVFAEGAYQVDSESDED